MKAEAEKVMVLKDKGREWTVRVVQKGSKYGQDDCLTYDGNMPMVEFYDRKPGWEPYGQFVSRYAAETLLSRHDDTGVNLHGGVPDWSISGKGMSRVIDWLIRIVEADTNAGISIAFGTRFLESCRKGNLAWLQENIDRIKAGRYLIRGFDSFFYHVSRPTLPNIRLSLHEKERCLVYCMYEAFDASHDDLAGFLASEIPALMKFFLYELFFKACRNGDTGWAKENMELLRGNEIDQSVGLREAFKSGQDNLLKFILAETPELGSIYREESFLRACREGDLKWLQGQELSEDFNFCTGLEEALGNGQDDLFVYLLEKIPATSKQVFETVCRFSIFSFCRIAAVNGNLKILRYIIEVSPRLGYPVIDCRTWWASRKWKDRHGIKIEVNGDVRNYLNRINKIQRQVGIEEGFRNALSVGIDDYIGAMKKYAQIARKRKGLPPL